MSNLIINPWTGRIEGESLFRDPVPGLSEYCERCGEWYHMDDFYRDEDTGKRRCPGCDGEMEEP